MQTADFVGSAAFWPSVDGTTDDRMSVKIGVARLAAS